MSEKAVLPQKFFTPVVVWHDEPGEVQIQQSPGHYICVDNVRQLIEVLQQCLAHDSHGVTAV